MKLPRIRPYETHVVDPSGTRTRLGAHEIVLERPLGGDLEINLAPHPRFRGRVSFSTFRGRCIVVEPAASNGLYLFIEDWPRGDPRRKEDRRRKRPPLCHVYAVDARGGKTPITGRSFAIEVGRGMELEVNLTPAAPWAHHVHIQTFDRPLELHFNAANSVQVTVEGSTRG